MSSTAPEMDDDRATDLARVLVTRLSEARHFGQDGESYPLILDDPFVELDSSLKPSLLELLGHNVLSPQVIFLTEDEDVASWARLEALTGALSIIEPTPATVEKQADPFVVAL
jgi:DNA repair exonuclease SbcCD ATPase subunit